MFNFTRATRAAFTIIELLVVIAIILFLVKLVVPRYSHYYARARQAEVAINLSNLYTAQQTFHVENGRYATTLKELSWHPKGATGKPETAGHYYTYGIGSGSEGITFFTGSSKTPANLLGSCSNDADHFVFKAVAKTGDTVDIWRIDETGDLRQEKKK